MVTIYITRPCLTGSIFGYGGSHWILFAPSWGGMINGVLTLSGSWDKLRTDPIIRFLIVALSFYAMSTFEGPMLSIKAVNAIVAIILTGLLVMYIQVH